MQFDIGELLLGGPVGELSIIPGSIKKIFDSDNRYIIEFNANCIVKTIVDGKEFFIDFLLTYNLDFDIYPTYRFGDNMRHKLTLTIRF